MERGSGGQGAGSFWDSGEKKDPRLAKAARPFDGLRAGRGAPGSRMHGLVKNKNQKRRTGVSAPHEHGLIYRFTI